MGWFRRIWNGEEQLWKVAWIYGALFILLGYTACLALKTLAHIDVDSHATTAGKIFTYFAVFYTFLLLVCLWRCAVNAEWDGWEYLVRAMVILYVVVYGCLCYTQHQLASPKKAFTADGIKLLANMVDWLFAHVLALVRSIRVRA
jgi:hypothetical protein